MVIAMVINKGKLYFYTNLCKGMSIDLLELVLLEKLAYLNL